MCRSLLIHKMVVPSHHIRAYLCHNIPNHCDVTGSTVTSSCPLFAADVVMTPLLTSLQQQNAHGNRWQIPALWGSAPQYPKVPYPSST